MHFVASPSHSAIIWERSTPCQHPERHPREGKYAEDALQEIYAVTSGCHL